MPRTTNGKVDRKALPPPDSTSATAGATLGIPTTPLERVIADSWRQELGVEEVSVFDNFYDLGGHSLLSMKVVAGLEKRLGLRISPKELMVQTLGQLASDYENRLRPRMALEPTGTMERLIRTIKRATFRRV